MRQTAKRCGIPSLSPPFRHRPTRGYHPSASHGAPTLSGYVLTLSIVRPPLRHGPIVLRSAVNGGEAPMADGLLRATGCDAHAGTHDRARLFTNHLHAPARESSGQASTQTNRKAKHHCTTPRASAAKSLRLRLRLGLITKPKSRHAYETLTHGLRSLRFRHASCRKRELLEVLRAVQDTRTSTEIWLMPVSRV